MSHPNDEKPDYNQDIVFIDQLNPTDEPPPDMEAIMKIEKGLSEGIRLLIEQALSDKNATFETFPLVGKVHEVEEIMELTGGNSDQITPTYRVQGLTYTDGKVFNKIRVSCVDENEYTVTKILRIVNPTIMVVSDWYFGQNDKNGTMTDKDIAGPRPLSSEGSFHRSISHKIYAKHQKNFNDYIGYKLAQQMGCNFPTNT
jgi:hypothetical protein